MKNLLILLVFLVATGCASFQKSEKILPEVVIQNQTEYLVPQLNISQDLLEPCKPLETLSMSATFEDVLVNTTINTVHYSNCSAKQQSLARILKNSLPVEEAK